MPNRNPLLRAATIVSVAFIISRILGLVRGAIILAYFDISTLEGNAYEIANRIPEAIFYIVAGGAIGSAYIPTFAAYFARDDEKGGWQLFANVLNLLILFLVIICTAIALLAEPLLELIYGSIMAENPGLLPLTANLMRLMLISIVIFGASGILMVTLNARQHFVLPAIAPIIYNLGIIAGTVLFAPNVMGIGIGTIIGAAGHLLIQLPGMQKQKAVYSFTANIHDAGVRQVLKLMAPRVLGLSFGQINHLITTFLAQFMILGSIPALANAWRIMLMPQGAIGQALGIVAFPTFATLAARNELAQMRRVLANTVRLILFLGMPATVLLIFFSTPIISLLFGRGRIGADDIQFMAWGLIFYAFGLIGLSLIEVISRAFYAMEDTVTPVMAGAVQLIVMAALGWWFSTQIFPQFGWLALGGLALGVSISNTLEAVFLMMLLSRKMQGIESERIVDGFWRTGLAGIGLAIVLYFLQPSLTSLSPFWHLAIGSAVSGVLYLAFVVFLRVEEITSLLASLRRLGNRPNG